MEDLTSPSEDVELNEGTMVHKVEQPAEKLKLWKAVGPNEIPNEVLKVPGVWDILCKLFNVCFEKSLITAIWKFVIIKPILNWGLYDKYCPVNYCCISLVSCTAKLYTTVLNRRLVRYCDKTGCTEEE